MKTHAVHLELIPEAVPRRCNIEMLKVVHWMRALGGEYGLEDYDIATGAGPLSLSLYNATTLNIFYTMLITFVLFQMKLPCPVARGMLQISTYEFYSASPPKICHKKKQFLIIEQKYLGIFEISRQRQISKIPKYFCSMMRNCFFL